MSTNAERKRKWRASRKALGIKGPSRSEYQRAYRARMKLLGVKPNTPEQMLKSKAWLKETYHALRSEMYRIVGAVCVGCGIDDVRVLEFDHVRDDGAEDRRKFNGARSMLQHYVANPDEARARLQTVCRNCNWLKRKGFDIRAKSETI